MLLHDNILFLHEATASRLLPLYFSGKASLLLPKEKEQPRLVASYYDEQDIADAKANTSNTNAMIIPIMGVITRYGDACSLGIDDMIAAIDRANADASVSTIVFQIDSPGGSANGLIEMAAAIATSPKKTIASVRTAASAACWIATACNEVLLENAYTSSIGSMSAFILYNNIGKKLREEGNEWEIIRADGSPQKFKPNQLEPLTDAERKQLVVELNEAKALFKASVLSGRGDRFTFTDTDFNGQMFSPKIAIEKGLADGIAPFKTTLKNALKTPSTNQTNTYMLPSLQKLATKLGIDPDLSKDEKSGAIEALLAEKDTQLSTQAATILGLTSELKTAKDGAAAAAETLQQLRADIIAKDEQIKTLETQFSNVPQPQTPTKDALVTANDYEAKMMALPEDDPNRAIFEATKALYAQ